MARLINQPTSKPTRKMSAVGISGSLATILIFVASEFGIKLPAEVAVAITAVIVFASGYLTKNVR